jgi:hypothetical protein
LVLALVFVIIATALASPSDIYFDLASHGSNNGTSCVNARAYSSMAAGDYTPGNILHICGTGTGTAGSTAITVQGSGTSGNPVTLKFETGAVLQAPYWGDNPFSGDHAAIVCVNKSWITIDGGTNGVIKSTANGTGLANTHNSTGIDINGCTNVEIKNIEVGPIYLHQQDDGSGGNTSAIFTNNANGIKIHDSRIHDAYLPINVGYSGSSVTGEEMYSNTIDHGCHMIGVGDANSGASASNLSFHDNTIGPHNTEWTMAGQNCHGDGIMMSAFNSGSTVSNTQIYNNLITSDMCNATVPDSNFNCTALIFLTGDFEGGNIFNNVLLYTVQTFSGYESLIRIAPHSYGGAQINNFKILNNTFIGNNSNQSCDCAAIKSDGPESGFVSMNNIFVHIGPKPNYLNEEGTIAGVYSNGIDYNDYYDYSGIGVDFTNSQNYNWSSGLIWTQPHATNNFPGYDTHGSNGDPKLDSNYKPQSGSAAIGLGQNLTNLCSGALTPLCFDKAGVARPSSGAWDAGAYQDPPGDPPPAPPTGLSAAVQ